MIIAQTGLLTDKEFTQLTQLRHAWRIQLIRIVSMYESDRALSSMLSITSGVCKFEKTVYADLALRDLRFQ
jgi:hypothetical protein